MNWQNVNSDVTWASVANWYWRSWEVSVGIVAASIPALRPGWRVISSSIHTYLSHRSFGHTNRETDQASFIKQDHGKNRQTSHGVAREAAGHTAAVQAHEAQVHGAGEAGFAMKNLPGDTETTTRASLSSLAIPTLSEPGTRTKMYFPRSFLITFCYLSLHSFSFPLTKRTIFAGPAIASNFPDPSFLEVHNTFYAFSTNNGKQNIPMATSPSFSTNWTILQNHDAIPRLPHWTTGNIWAPSVIRLPHTGLFILYFSGTSRTDKSKHCIGAATSRTITGPFRPYPKPLICDLEAGGAIDASPFLDPVSRKLYLTWKIDGNSLGGGGPCGNADSSHSTPLQIAPLNPRTGTSFLGPATTILDRDPKFDGPLIEAPSLAYCARERLYLLFFSSNCYNTELYDTSYATSRNILGPYEKAKEPLLVSGDYGGRMKSPGGAEVSPDARRIAFHGNKEVGDVSVRQMWVGELRVKGGVVTI
ncbi:MAG: hypothetical protein Q9221_004271 [Calogaya cf. arnoldii]